LSQIKIKINKLKEAKRINRPSPEFGRGTPSTNPQPDPAASLSGKRPNAEQILQLQQTVGNRAVARYLKRGSPDSDSASPSAQSKRKGQILLSYSQMQDVYASFVESISASRGYPTSKEGMTQVHADALVKMAGQIGPANFEHFIEMGGGEFTYIPPKKIAEEAEQIEAEETEAASKESQDPMGDLYAAMRMKAQNLNKSATNLLSSIARAEYLTHMLKEPEGAKKIASKIAIGALGVYAAGKNAYDYAKETVEDTTKQFVDPIGYVTDKVADEAVGKKEDKPTFEEKSDEFGQTVGTTVEAVSGQLMDLYLQTRPSYNAFNQAYESFSAAYSAYWRSNDFETLSEQLGQMIKYHAAMKDAANQYLMCCEMLGIRRKAAEYIALDKAVVESLKSTVTSAVDVLGGEMMPDMGVTDKIADKAADKLPKSVSDKTKEVVKKNIKEKALNPVAGLPGEAAKKYVEAQAQEDK
jgi:hypothetical protein